MYIQFVRTHMHIQAHTHTKAMVTQGGLQAMLEHSEGQTHSGKRGGALWLMKRALQEKDRRPNTLSPLFDTCLYGLSGSFFQTSPHTVFLPTSTLFAHSRGDAITATPTVTTKQI